MNYIRYFLATAFAFICVIATFNFVIDPARIYRESFVSPDEYARRLLNSQRGLFLPPDGMNERILAQALIRSSPRQDCVVLGSSHVMQISSARRPRALAETCTSILNLGVSGAGLEDQLILSRQVAKQGLTKKLVLEVAPWTLAFNKDDRWANLEDERQVQQRLSASGSGFPDTLKALVKNRQKSKNLINMEYTLRSLSTAARYWRDGFPKITDIGALDLSVGGPLPARLADGSHVYSAQYIASSRATPIPPGGSVYKTDGELNEKKAIATYRDLLNELKQQGIEPILLMTPYHQNVWQVQNSPNTVAMVRTGQVVQQLAKDLNIKVIGSYDPKVAGCSNDEFYDFMHANSECLARLKIQ